MNKIQNIPLPHVMIEKLCLNIDHEDFEYLKKSLYTMFTGMNESDLNKLDFGGSNSSDSSACSLFGQSSSDHCQWTGGNQTNNNDYHKFFEDSDFTDRSDSSSSSSKHQCDTLFNEILEKGIDKEDLEYLNRSFVSILWDANQQYWTKNVCWKFHPATSDDFDSNNSKLNHHSPLNKTGCARTEGYFKVDKSSYLKNKVSPIKDEEMSVSNKSYRAPYSKSYKGNKKSMSREARNDQRRLFTAYQTITGSDLLKLNELKFRKKKLRLGKSEIHGLGLFASEPIPPNEMIIEYVGQIIRPVIADLREKEYKSSGIGSYCFRVDDDTIIDATKYGNLNRYINHSCNPNSYAKILIINNQKKIVIYSKKLINVDEEITYDYKMPFEDEKIVCLCRAPGCRKSLN